MQPENKFVLDHSQEHPPLLMLLEILLDSSHGAGQCCEKKIKKFFTLISGCTEQLHIV